MSFNIFALYLKLRKYLNNTLWIMGDKVVGLGVSFLVTVVVARYLGPENFGILSYAISLSALFAAAGHVGLSGLVVREIVKKPDERSVTLGTTLGLKLIGMVLGYTLLLSYAAVYEGVRSNEFLIIAIAGAALLLLPFDTVDFWFQAFVQARYVTFARLAGLAVGSFLKLAFVFFGFGLTYLAFANLVQAIAIAVALLLIYKIKSRLALSSWKFDICKAKELLSQGWMIYLGSIFSVIYLKVDLVMLRWLKDAETVGIYAVAAQISEAWYFVPTAIVASFFPKLILLKEENQAAFNMRLQQLFDVLFVLALCVAVAMTLVSEWVIISFFGAHYVESASILVIHAWAAIFIFIRAAFSRWILIEGVLMFSLITQGLGALVNVALNFVLIPGFGAQGAAYATLISYAVASFLSLFIYGKTRPVFLMMLKSFFCFFRYIPVRFIK